MSLTWSSYVAPKLPKRGLKTQNGHFLSTVWLKTRTVAVSMVGWAVQAPGLHYSCGQTIICLCGISPEYSLTGRPSIIPTARRRDPRVQPHQMSLKQRRWCSNKEWTNLIDTSHSDVVVLTPRPFIICYERFNFISICFYQLTVCCGTCFILH